LISVDAWERHISIDVCQYVDVTKIRACCQPVLTSPLRERQAEELAAAFKVLADPARLRLLSAIANAPDGEACVCELVDTVGKAQPTVSHHLSVLADAGLVRREKRGRWAWYAAVPERLAVLRDALAG
jgi:ArsR family transcriptional regulator